MMEKLQVLMLYLKCLQALKVTIDKHMQNTCVTCIYFEGAILKILEVMYMVIYFMDKLPKEEKGKITFSINTIVTKSKEVLLVKRLHKVRQALYYMQRLT